MKLLITLNVLSVVFYSITAAMNAFQNKWFMAAIWSVGALCFVVTLVIYIKMIKKGY